MINRAERVRSSSSFRLNLPTHTHELTAPAIVAVSGDISVLGAVVRGSEGQLSTTTSQLCRIRPALDAASFEAAKYNEVVAKLQFCNNL
jgi:hypothetical protein